MRIKYKIQVGAHNIDRSKLDDDLLFMLNDREKIMKWAAKNIVENFKVIKVWNMADGMPHLIEFEGIIDKVK